MQHCENNVNTAVRMYVCGLAQLPMTLCAKRNKAKQQNDDLLEA